MESDVTSYTEDDFAFARIVLADPTSTGQWRSGAVQILLKSQRHDDIELASREVAGRSKARPAQFTASTWALIGAAVLAAAFVGYQLGRFGMEIWLGVGQVLDQAETMRGM